MTRRLLALLAAWLPAWAPSAVADEALRFDVVIAGGSTAACAAAFAAADEGATVALLEPTDWIGGQLTASGVPAVDEAWHKITDNEGRVLLDVAAAARDPRNMTPDLRDALQAIGNPGGGWVSRFCFEPQRLLDRFLIPRERELSERLTIFRETVVKRAVTDGRRVTELIAIRRTPRPGIDGYDRPPSADLADWYAPNDSPRFTKQTLRLRGRVFIDATEWGELLALTDAPWLQGAEEDQPAAPDSGLDVTGQSIVYGFVQRMHDRPVDDHRPIEPPRTMGYGAYAGRDNAWSLIWTYRRLLGEGPSASPGELSLQNWGYDPTHNEGGNDYPFGYVLLSRVATRSQTNDWRGGVDPEVLAGAERRALAWHEWFRHAAPAPINPDQITLDGATFGTRHGLSKLPYLRDTRRSVGVDGFVLRLEDLTGQVVDGRLDRRTGTPFKDRVALGAYPADIHPLVGYNYPPGVEENHPTLPFYVPLRALTNDAFDNLLVTGKTMAQSFLANAATRLHPIEWSTGTACGVVAADLAETGATTRAACRDFVRLREKVARRTPVDWTLPSE